MPCTYQPDCAADKLPGLAVCATSYTSVPWRSLCRYSPWSLKLVRVALPLGAHFHTASATHTRVRPLKELVTASPATFVCTRLWSLSCAFSTDRPARQLWLSPMSPPRCAVSTEAPAPLPPDWLPGKLRPRPTSAPSSMKVSLGASQVSCSPSSPNCVPRKAW